MKSITYLLPVLGLVGCTMAASCSSSVAIPLDSAVDDPTLSAEINSLASDVASDLIKVRAKPKRQAGLDCTSAEGCFSLDDLVFCFDPSSYDIRIDDGSSANLLTGDYTLSDGETGNLYTDVTSSESGTSEATSTRNTLSAQTTRAGASTTSTTSRPSANASPTATSNVANGNSAATSTNPAPSPSESSNSGGKFALNYGFVLAVIGAYFL